ncbi:MAG: winged helix-turn-helix transcriptional regulator [Lachnospiraceae bacterium]|nr:winged helix-turn-helix transcriptional regulator [Lachnospiraceae bacterium]
MTSATLGNILYISRSYSTYQRSFAGGTELQPSQITLITYVCRNPGSRQDSLTDALGIDKTRLTHRLNDLEKRGYITREISAEDARVRLIFPTEKAEAAYPELHAHFEAFMREIFGDLSEEDGETLERLLKQVRQRAKDVVKRVKNEA